jgi:5-methylcytosine-specific restriction endonuclease McrA
LNTDIRLSVSFKGHRKRRKLRLLLGDNSTDYLIDLWITVAQDRPTGVLTGWSPTDIALAAGWEGDAAQFVEALVNAGLLEEAEGVYRLHDWEDHQPWVCKAPQRSEGARRSAAAKWGGSSSTAYRSRAERLSEARAKGTHTDSEWQEVVAFFQGHCVRCGVKAEVVKDHIIPIYQGGSDAITNLQPLCRRCNSSKGPESTDYRLVFCETNACEMPAEWLRDACANACEMPAPSPSPSPSPSPIPSTSSIQELVIGGVGDAPDGATAPIEESGEDTTLPEMTPLEDELANLQSWGRFTMEDRAWVESVTADYPDTIPRDVRDMRDHWMAKAKKHSRNEWKRRLRTWLRKKRDFRGGNGNGHRGLPGNRYGGAFSDITS